MTNTVTKLHLDDFAGLTGLMGLWLDRNQLTELPAGLFDGLTGLTALNLSDNALVVPPAGLFDGLTRLTHLNLDRNQLTELPAGLFDDLTALTALGLSDNLLVALPAGLFDGPTALTYLYLEQNQLTALPAGLFEDLTSLTLLELSGNPGPDGDTATNDYAPVAVAGAAPADLPAGGEVTLDASGSDGGPWGTNVIHGWVLTDPASGATATYAPDAASPVTTATVTETLTHGGTLIFTLTVTGRGGAFAATDTAGVSVPARGICGRTPVVRDAILAALSGNPGCETVADDDARLAGITGTLNLGNKGITALAEGDFAGLTGLTTLWMDENPLTELPAGLFDDLTALTALDLSDNSLTALPVGLFGDLTALTFLHLDGNQLTELPAEVFTGLGSLTSLDLSGNSLTTLPAGLFGDLTALTGLYLSHNLLGSLPDDVFEPLTALTTLLLSGNPGADDFLPTAVAFSPIPSIPPAGGEVLLHARRSDGGPWGANVTYSWALTDPASGVTATYAPDAAGPVTTATVSGTMTHGDTLTFTLTVTGRGGAFASTHSADVLVRLSGICGRTPVVRDAILAALSDNPDCADVTDDDARLAGITGALGLDNQGITELHQDDFAGLTGLTELDLSSNALTELPTGLFDDLTALTVLDLSNNALVELPAKLFDDLTALTVLDLSNNALVELPAKLFDDLTALTYLYLEHNQLTELPAKLFDGPTELTTLWLDRNQLTELPAKLFDGLPELTTLSLNNNRLGSLLAGLFGDLTSLTRLSLNNNRLGSLPAGLFEDLTSLTLLELSGNPGPDGDTATNDYAPVARAIVRPGGQGMASLDGSGSDGGPWGGNVTYGWELTSPGGATAAYAPDNASPVTTATVSGVLAGGAAPAFTLTVTGRGGAFAATDTHAAVTNSDPTGAPTISGNATVGETLTAATGDIADANGRTAADFSHQWLRVDADGASNPVNIGTDSDTYTLNIDDFGKKIRVRVDFVDDDYYAETLTSAAWPSQGTIAAPAETFVSVSPVTPTVMEGDPAQFRFRRIGGMLSAPLSVGVSITGHRKTMSAETRTLLEMNKLADKVVEFAAGEDEVILAITTEADQVNEGDGQIKVRMLSVSLFAFDGADSATLLVVDDDIPEVSLKWISPAGMTLVGNTLKGVMVEGSDIEFEVECTGGYDAPESSTTGINSYPRIVGHIVETMNQQLRPGTHNRFDRDQLFRWPCADRPAPLYGQSMRSGRDRYTSAFNGELSLDLLPQRRELTHPDPPYFAGGVFAGAFHAECNTDSVGGTPSGEQFCPKYTLGAVTSARIQVLNRNPVITVEAIDDVVEEGAPARFRLTRHWASDLLLDVMDGYTTTFDFGVYAIGDYVANAPPGNSRRIFGTGETEIIIEILTDDDHMSEADGSVTLELAPGVPETQALNIAGSYEIVDFLDGITPPGKSARIATVRIRDDDDTASTTVTLTVDPVSVAEGAGATAIVVTGTLNHAALTGDTLVTLSPGAPGDTASAADYEVTGPFDLVIPAGATSGTLDITLTPVDDALHEGEGEESLTLAGTTDMAGLTVIPAALGITDNDTASTTVTLTVDPVSVAEGAGATAIVVTGTLNHAALTGDTLVTLSPGAPGDTASAADYEVTGPFDLVIPAGATSGTLDITLTPVDDALHEGEGEESLTLAGTTDMAGLTVIPAALGITDNDTASTTVTPVTVTVTEGGSATYTVELTSQPTGPVTVTPSVSDNPDVTVPPEALVFTMQNWSDAQTVTVTTLADADAQDETATVTHTVAGGDYDAVMAADVEVTVVDDNFAGGAPATRNLAERMGDAPVTAVEAIGDPVMATDTDGDPLTYALEGTDADRFTFDTSTGQISTRMGENYDHEVTPICIVTVTARDSNGGTAVMAVTINVNDRNEPPLAPDAPTMSPTTDSTTSLDVSWDAPDNMGRPAIMSYDLRYKKTPDSTWTDGPQNVSGMSASISGLEPDTAYEVQVRATNDEGVGPWSAFGTGSTAAIPDRTAPVASWLPRFGRTVSEQVVEAAQARMAATPVAGLAGQLAGQTIAIAPGRGSAEARADAEADFAALGESFFGAGDSAAASHYSSRALTGRDFLTGSAFALTGHSGDSAATLWGRGAVTSFDGRDGSLSLDGEVVSGMLGIDWRNGERSGGLMLSRSRGEGDYRSSAAGGAASDDGRISATLTGLYPWLGHRVNDRLTLWGVAGYGRGTLTLTPAGEDALSAGIGLTMGSVGARGRLGAGAEGMVLAWEADALALRTTSDAASGAEGRLDATSSGVTRVRLGLTGSRRFRLGSGAALTPGLEVGLRHDGGDAETGFGTDIGVSLDFADPARGITAAVSARGLLDHAAQGFRERGLSATLTWDQRPGSDLGWSLSLGHGVGAATEGGAASLLARQSLAGLLTGDGDDGADTTEGNLQRRFDATLGYGVPMAAGRFVAVSGIGFGLTDAGREYSVGWRLGLARSGPMDLHLGLEATRQESTTGSPTHDLGLDLGAAIRW